MSKRFFALAVCFVLICLMASPMTAYADVVMMNDFLHENEKDAKQIGKQYSGKQFVVNSPAGYVIPKEEPGSEQGISTNFSYKGTSPGGRGDNPYTYSGEVFQFMNGEIITITHTYFHNGEYWGVMSHSHNYQPAGWILMDELLMLYDRQDFEAESKDSFYAYTGSYDAVLNAEKLVEWEWPGADKEKKIIEKGIAEYADVLYAYQDVEGREWGKTKYSGGWICLSDPENSEIPSFYPTAQSRKWSPDDIDPSDENTVYPPVHPSSPDQPDNGSPALLIVSFIAVAVAVTAVLLILLQKRKKRRKIK